MIYVTCLDTGVQYGFVAETPYDAMDKMLYTLNLKRKDPEAKINLSKLGFHLWMEHSGKTYSTRIN